MTRQPPREIELKLALPPGEAAAFLARMARRRTQPVCQTLHTRYFDTPDFDLSRAGVALRVRRAGRRWVQTLKTEGERLGGLSQRTEYEMPVARGEPDWPRFPDEALAHVPASLRARLVPVFETRFARTAWLLAGRGGAQIEVALDRGEVRAGPRRAPLCELELELKHGQPDALFELARTWAAAFGCVPNDESKAARGVRLAHGGAPAPVRSGALALDPGQSMEDAFGAICRDALAHFQANLPGVLASDDIEFVHQARVALRRLRAILRVSRRACVPPPALLDGLRVIAAALGPTRDWDVLCGETWPAIMQHFDDVPACAAETARLQAHQTAVRDAMRAALTQARPGVWLLDMARWLLARGWRDAPEPQRRLQRSPLAGWARDTLRRGHRAVLRDIRRFDALTPVERHALRIRIKRLRYALEFFLALYPGRNHARLLAALRSAQDTLGQANDAHVAAHLLKSLPKPAASARAFALGWLAARSVATDTGENAKALKNIVKLRVDW